MLPLGLVRNDNAVTRQLADLGIGSRVKNYFVQYLYQKGRFTLVGYPERFVAQQWVAMNGAVDTQTAIEYGKKNDAQYVVYGQVKEFGVSKIKRRQWEVKLELQIRLLAMFEERVPESFDRDVTLICRGPFNDELEVARRYFDALSKEALKPAVCDLVRRFPDWTKTGAFNDCSVMMAPEGCEVVR